MIGRQRRNWKTKLLTTRDDNDAIPSQYSHAHFRKVFASFPTSAACSSSLLYFFKKERAHSRWIGFGFLFLIFFFIQPVPQRRYQTTLISFQSMPYHALKQRRLILSELIFLRFISVPSCKNIDGDTSLWFMIKVVVLWIPCKGGFCGALGLWIVITHTMCIQPKKKSLGVLSWLFIIFFLWVRNRIQVVLN